MTREKLIEYLADKCRRCSEKLRDSNLSDKEKEHYGNVHVKYHFGYWIAIYMLVLESDDSTPRPDDLVISHVLQKLAYIEGEDILE